tara:strand:+ start:2976 stop:5543 length:2568 start_codon:yes stop_codon:yes gene_type:complete
MEWEDLPIRVQNKINASIAKTYFKEGEDEGGEMSDDAAEKIVEKLEGITAPQLKRMVSVRYTYYLDRDKIFNPTSGVASKFALGGGKLITELPAPGNRVRKIDVTAKQLQGKPLLPTQAALDDKENILRDLNEAKDNDELVGGLVPFTNEELETIDNMINAFEESDVELEEAEEYEIGEFAAIKKITRSLTSVEGMTTQAREEYYNFWESVYDDFENLIDYFRKMEPIFTKLEGFVDVEGELKELLEGKYLPNYVLKLRPMPNEELIEDWKVQKLIYEFLKFMGHAIPQSLEIFGAEKEIGSKLYGTMASEQPYKLEGGIDTEAQPIATMDPTMVDEVQADIEDKISAMEKEDIYVDPIFLLLARNEDISENYLETTMQQAKEEIPKFFNMGKDATSEAFKTLKSALDNEIDIWIDKYRKAGSVSAQGGYHHISLLDNYDTVEIFDGALGRGRKIIVQAIKFEKDDIDVTVEEFDSYGEAVKWVNDHTIEFFEILGNLIKLSGGTLGVFNRPVRTQGLGRDKGDSAYLAGSTHLPLPQKITEADAGRLQQIDNILKLKESYYFEPLDGEHILLDDKPAFFESKSFQAFRDIVEGSLTSRAKTQLRQGAMPNITTRDYKNMNAWITKLQNRSELLYEDKLVDIFENALEAFINFWTVAVRVNEESDLLTTLNEQVTTIFGEALYEIAFDTFGSDEAIENVPLKWAKKPLKYWREAQEEKQYFLNNLLTMIDSPEYNRFVQKKMSSESGLYSQHKNLVRKLKKGADVLETGPITHAMLEATDMIRKMNNMKVYYSNLDVLDIDDLSYVINVIKKEHGIDIYAVDIHNIINSQSSFNDIAKSHGVADEVVYKVKGLFR